MGLCLGVLRKQLGFVKEKERKKERFRVPVRGKCVRALGSRRRERCD